MGITGTRGLTPWLRGKESACSTGDIGSIAGSGRSPGGGHDNPLQYSCLESPMDRGAWQATVHRAAKSWAQLKRLSVHVHTRTPHTRTRTEGHGTLSLAIPCYGLMPWSEVKSCPTLCDPIDCSLSGSSVHEIFQARVLESIAISFSRGSSRPRNRTRVSHITGRRFTVWVYRVLILKRGFKGSIWILTGDALWILQISLEDFSHKEGGSWSSWDKWSASPYSAIVSTKIKANKRWWDVIQFTWLAIAAVKF